MVPGLLAIQLLRCTEKNFDGNFCRFGANFAPFWDPIRFPIQDPPSGGSTEGYVVQLSEGRAGASRSAPVELPVLLQSTMGVGS